MAQAELTTRDYPTRTLTGVQILATGGFVPDNEVKNEDLAELGYDADWILKRTGIRARRHAPPEMATSDMALEAALRCLEMADCDAADVDLLILGTFTPDAMCPATAAYVQDRLGVRCAAFDLQAACSGFAFSIITGAQFIAAGTAERALIIGADTNSRIINPKDEKTYPLFGDGAGAVLLGPGSNDQGMLAYNFGSDGSGAELLHRLFGGTRIPVTPEGIEQELQFLTMEGRSVFKWAVRLVDDSVRQVVEHAGLTIDDIDYLVLHQANVRIIDAAVDDLGISRDKVLINLDRYGNTSAASIPLVLDEAVREGKIKLGANVVMAGFGAGLTWGTILFRW